MICEACGVVQSGVTMSPTVGKLFEALAKAQLELEPAKKTAENPHYRAKFADLATVLEASRVLAKHGIALSQPPSSSDGRLIHVTTILGHLSGEWIKSDLAIPTAQASAQAAGSVISYARRYAAQAICGIASEDDDAEGAEGRHQDKPKSAPRVLSPKDAAKFDSPHPNRAPIIAERMAQDQTTDDTMPENFGATEKAEILADEAKEAVRAKILACVTPAELLDLRPEVNKHKLQKVARDHMAKLTAEQEKSADSVTP